MCSLSNASKELKPKVKKLLDDLKMADENGLEVRVVNPSSLKILITAMDLFYEYLLFLSEKA